MARSEKIATGVRIKEWKGSWWVVVNYHRQRKSVKVGPGARGKKLAQTAATRIAARLLSGDPTVFAPSKLLKVTTFAEIAKEWLTRYPALHSIRPSTLDNFRHTFASTLLSRNAPLLYVQQQGGWRSASVLLRVYARWMPQEGVQPVATPAQPGVAGQVGRVV